MSFLLLLYTALQIKLESLLFHIVFRNSNIICNDERNTFL